MDRSAGLKGALITSFLVGSSLSLSQLPMAWADEAPPGPGPSVVATSEPSPSADPSSVSNPIADPLPGPSLVPLKNLSFEEGQKLGCDYVTVPGVSKRFPCENGMPPRVVVISECLDCDRRVWPVDSVETEGPRVLGKYGRVVVSMTRATGRSFGPPVVIDGVTQAPPRIEENGKRFVYRVVWPHAGETSISVHGGDKDYTIFRSVANPEEKIAARFNAGFVDALGGRDPDGIEGPDPGVTLITGLAKGGSAEAIQRSVASVSVPLNGGDFWLWKSQPSPTGTVRVLDGSRVLGSARLFNPKPDSGPYGETQTLDLRIPSVQPRPGNRWTQCEPRTLVFEYTGDVNFAAARQVSQVEVCPVDPAEVTNRPTTLE